MSYDLLSQAIKTKQCVSAVYKGAIRHFSRHCMGYGKRGEMNVLGFQYGGDSTGTLPSWRCFRVEDLSGITLNSDAWATEGDHSKANTCVVRVLEQITF
jgi:hypothetical protein